MSRRLASATLLGLTLTVMHASAALAHQGGDEGDSVLPALITSFVAWLVCYVLMVWDPKGARK